MPLKKWPGGLTPHPTFHRAPGNFPQETAGGGGLPLAKRKYHLVHDRGGPNGYFFAPPKKILHRQKKQSHPERWIWWQAPGSLIQAGFESPGGEEFPPTSCHLRTFPQKNPALCPEPNIRPQHSPCSDLGPLPPPVRSPRGRPSTRPQQWRVRRVQRSQVSPSWTGG